MSHCIDNMLTALREVKRLDRPVKRAGEEFFRYVPQLAKLEAGRNRYYTDAPSQAVFDWVMQYRVVRSFLPKSVAITLENTPYSSVQWKELTLQAKHWEKGFKESDYLLDIIDTWILESYSLAGQCEVQPGDVVLDCGTYTGNTSWYFAEKTGPKGHVYGFEGASKTFATYREHMKDFANVTPVHAAVCEQEGVISFSGASPGAHIGQGDDRVPAVALDGFCQTQGIERVDFIKMDIEGAEAAALRGAAHIIRTHKPKMALSAYHKQFDLIDLPAVVLSICPQYRFALRHFSDETYETVLYCIPTEEAAGKEWEQPQMPILTEAAAASMFTLVAEIMAHQDLFDMSKKMLDQASAMAKALEKAAGDMKELLEENAHLKVEKQAMHKVLAKAVGKQ